MERPWVQKAIEEIKQLDQNPATRRLSEFKDRELKDILQREAVRQTYDSLWKRL